MTKKNKLVCCGIISSLKAEELCIFPAKPWKGHRSDNIEASQEPESLPPALLPPDVPKYLLWLLVFQEPLSVEKPALPTALHCCGAQGCAEEQTGLSASAAALCPCPVHLGLCGKAHQHYGSWWQVHTNMSGWTSLLSLGWFLTLCIYSPAIFCLLLPLLLWFFFIFSPNTSHYSGCYVGFAGSAACNSPSPFVCTAWLQWGHFAD